MGTNDTEPECEELQRCRVWGNDGSEFTAVEYRYRSIIATDRGARVQIGARHWRLKSGQPLRPIGADGFLHEPSGELFWMAAFLESGRHHNGLRRPALRGVVSLDEQIS